MLPCLANEQSTNFSIPQLDNCDVTLTSTSATLSVTDPNPAPDRLYQFYVNGGLAGSPQTSTQRPVSGLPTDGSTIIKEVRYSDDGGNTFLVGDTCTCTAFTSGGGNADLTPISGTKLETTSTSFTASIPAGSGATVADLYIIDSNGNNVFDGPSGPIDANGNFSITASGYPLDETTFTVFVDYFDFLPGGTKLGTITGTYTACDDLVVQPDKVMTFPELEALARQRLGPDAPLHFEDDIHYVAEFMAQRLCPYWQVQGQTVVGFDEPEPEGNVTFLPAPSGGDDTAMIEAALSNGALIKGTGQTYQTSGGIDVNNSDVRVWDVPLRALNGMQRFWDVNQDGFRLYRSPMDGNQVSTVRTGVYVNNAENVHVIKSGLSNSNNTVGTATNGTNGAHVHFVGQCSGHHVAMNVSRDVRNTSGPSSTHRANPYLYSGSGPSISGVLAANVAINFYSLGTLRDSDFVTFQSSDSAGPGSVLVMGNYAEDHGKRFGKNQDNTSVKYLSNTARWTIPDTAAVNRGRLCGWSFQRFGDWGASLVEIYNNHVSMEIQDNYVALVRNTLNTGGNGTILENIKVECNRFTTEASPTATFDHYFTTWESDFDNLSVGDTSLERSSVTFNQNLADGGGSHNRHYRTGPGFDLTGPIQRIGNIINVPNVNGFEQRL